MFAQSSPMTPQLGLYRAFPTPSPSSNFASGPSYPYPSTPTPAFTPAAPPASTRFSPQPFRYNLRVAAALLPTLIFIASYGGSTVATILIVGSMGAYILDGLRVKEGSFAAVWATLAVAHLALAYAMLTQEMHEFNVPLALMALVLGGLALFLTGAWVTLHFVWVQLQYPAVAIALEKMVLVGALPLASTVFTWAAMEGVGAHTAGFYQAGVLCTLYYLFGLPLPTSFSKRNGQLRRHDGGAIDSRRTVGVQSASDGFIAFLLVACLPACTYAATHSSDLFHWIHLWSILLLGCGPLVFITALRDGMWWAGTGRAVGSLQRVLLLLALAGAIAGIEGRLVFYSFGQYIRLAPPWSYLAITLGLYGAAALALLLASGALGEGTVDVLLGPVLMLSAAVVAVVLGMPPWMLPAPLCAAAGLALFYESRSARDYMIFFVGGLACTGWFLWHHFWFLSDISIDGMPLRTLCLLLFVSAAPGLLAPGIALSDGLGRTPLEVLLFVQAALIVFTEEKLYAGDHAELTHNLHPMFPPALVIATSAVGVAMTRRLRERASIGDLSSYFLQCVYAAKLFMLAVPEARLALPAVGLALAIAPPLLLDSDDTITGTPALRGQSRRHRRIAPWQGIAMAAAVFGAVVAARFAIFDVLRLVLNRRPSEALALGSLFLASASGCIPLVSTYYANSLRAKRALLLTAVAGLLLALLRPPLPIRGGARCPNLPMGLCPRLWNEEHAPEHEEDDVAVYGDGLRRREHWPLWLLVGAAFAGVVAATSPAPVRHAAPLRLSQAAVSAALVGAYMALEFFPGMFAVQVLVAASALLTAAAVVLLQLPTRGGAILVPALGLVWAGALPATLAAQAASALPPLPPEAQRLLPDFAEGIELEVERREAVKIAVLVSFAAEALLLAFALKLRVGAASAAAASRASGPSFAAEASYIDTAADFLGSCLPAMAIQPGSTKAIRKGPANAAQQRLAAEGFGWAPLACNVVTFMCFGLSLRIGFAFSSDDPTPVPLLVPILLLLTEDSLLCRGLVSHRRYFPPALATAMLLGYKAAADIWRSTAVLEDGLSLDWYYVVMNGGLLLLCLLPQVEFLRYLWSRNRVSVIKSVFPGVIALGMAYFAEVEAARILAALTALAGGFLAVRASQVRQASRKFI